MTIRHALIGLGNVGTDLTASAVRAGLELHVCDTDAEALARASAAGATAHLDAGSAARGSDVLVLSLPHAEAVDAVLHEDGALAALPAGSCLMDMSTNLPANAVALAEEGRRRGLRVVDAPVSYGPNGLVAFVGCEQADIRAVTPWLDAVTTSWEHVGGHGNGQYVKLVQNILSGVSMGVIAEVLGFAAKAGVDLDVLPDALRWTGAHSPMLEQCVPGMRARRYGDKGTLALHRKDMGYALRAAEEIGAQLPFTDTLHTVFSDILATGDPRWNQTALIEWYDPAAPHEVSEG